MIKKVISTPEHRREAQRMVMCLDLSKPLMMEIKEVEQKRSAAQNNLFHMWVGEITEKYPEATGDYYTFSVWKHYLKQLFLGETSATMPDGTIGVKVIGTSDLNVKQYSKLLEKIDHYAGSELGINLTRPEEIYYQAMGYKKSK